VDSLAQGWIQHGAPQCSLLLMKLLQKSNSKLLERARPGMIMGVLRANSLALRAAAATPGPDPDTLISGYPDPGNSLFGDEVG